MRARASPHQRNNDMPNETNGARRATHFLPAAMMRSCRVGRSGHPSTRTVSGSSSRSRTVSQIGVPGREMLPVLGTQINRSRTVVGKSAMPKPNTGTLYVGLRGTGPISIACGRYAPSSHRLIRDQESTYIRSPAVTSVTALDGRIIASS